MEKRNDFSDFLCNFVAKFRKDIDNGYGAGYLATQINRLALGTKED